MHHHQYTLTVPKTSCREFAKVKVSPQIYLCMQRYYSLPTADDMNQVIHVKNVYGNGLKRCRFLYDWVKYIVFIDKSCGFRWLFSDFFFSNKFLLSQRRRRPSEQHRWDVQQKATYSEIKLTSISQMYVIVRPLLLAAKGKNISVGNRNLWKKYVNK